MIEERSFPSISEVSDFFDKQLSLWEEARLRFEGLKKIELKDLSSCGINIKAQFNPSRIVSTGAKVDKKTIAKRACFLCEKNRPEQQIKLTAFGGKFQVLVNPFPILKGHLTIPATAHTMQSIKGCYGNLCEIANALSGYVVFYNGPKCGASAPDHLHFQAGKRGDMPIEKYWKSYESNLQPVFIDSLFKLKGYACPALVIVARNIEESVSVFDKLYARLQQNGEEEFPINVLAWKEGDNIVTVIFLRKKHRPDCYFAEEEEQMIISPGSVDMGGLIITAREKDFKNITQQKAFDILKEVSLTEEEIDEILK